MLTTLPPSCVTVMKSGNLNFLEPFGPLQACNGTALPLLYARQPKDKILCTFLIVIKSRYSPGVAQRVPGS